MKRIALSSFIAVGVLAAAISFQISDPFGLKFWIPLYGVILGISLLLLIITWSLVTKTRVFVKLISIFPAALFMIFLLIFIGLAFDYRWILPGFPVGKLSEQEWKDDTQFLKTELKMHPAFKDSLTETFLSDQYPTKFTNDDERLVSLMELVGRFKDGHTLMHPLQAGLKARNYPLQGFWFDDGYFIVRAAKKYKDLIGKQIISINGIPIDKLFQKIGILYGAENEWQRKAQFDLFVFSANVLHGLQVASTISNCTIEYRSNGESNLMNVTSEPFFAWFFWYLKPISDEEWNPAYHNMRKPNYSLQYDSSYKGVRVNFNFIQSIKDWPIKSMAEDLTKAIATNPERVIFDLRNNLGGDNTRYKSLLKVIREHAAKTDFIFLVSRKTFSAGVNFISEAKAAGRIILVGEPTGAGPNHYGDAQHVMLPNSKLSLFVSTRKWKFDSLDNRKYYIPDIPVTYKSVHLREGNDPWLDALNSDSRLLLK